MKSTTVLAALLIVASWGFNAAIAKIGVLEFEPMAFLAVRMLLTALIFLPFARVKKSDLPLLLTIAVLLNVGHMGCIHVAFKFLPASSVTVLQQSQVPMAFIIACLFAHESITSRQIAGVILAIIGVICIFGLPELHFTGAVFALIGSLFWAFTQLVLKRSKHISPFVFMAYTALFSFPFLASASVLFENNVYETYQQANHIKFFLSLAYQVFAMAAAMMFWQRLVAVNGINKLAPFTLLQVLFGIWGGILFFNETISTYIILGAILTILGVSLTMFGKRAERKNNEKQS